MGATRRFYAVSKEISVFIFKIDTRLIVGGATDGSENPLTFRLPLPDITTTLKHTCTVDVDDGRPSYTFTPLSTTDDLTLHFATAGIYTITITGTVSNWSTYATWGVPSRKKIIEILKWGNFIFPTRAFYMCSNLVVNAPNVLVLPSSPSWFFQGIKEFKSSLALIDTSKATNMSRFMSGLQTPLNSILNPFFLALVTVTDFYTSIAFTNEVEGIEIVSDSITSLSQPWNLCTTPRAAGDFYLRIKTPNLTTMFRVIHNGDFRTKCHAGEIDVRNVTNTGSWLNSIMPQANVDKTLLGWANLPFMQSGVTWNWNGSKYSNTPEVIAAYNKITVEWGVIFTNLTMA